MFESIWIVSVQRKCNSWCPVRTLQNSWRWLLFLECFGYVQVSFLVFKATQLMKDQGHFTWFSPSLKSSYCFASGVIVPRDIRQTHWFRLGNFWLSSHIAFHDLVRLYLIFNLLASINTQYLTCLLPPYTQGKSSVLNLLLVLMAQFLILIPIHSAWYPTNAFEKGILFLILCQRHFLPSSLLFDFLWTLWWPFAGCGRWHILTYESLQMNATFQAVTLALK